jgi:hypothetical protein
METLAKQIEEGMHGVWKHCMIRDTGLERIWPINEEDREEKIAQFAKQYGFRLRFYGKGMCAIFDKWPPDDRPKSRPPDAMSRPA